MCIYKQNGIIAKAEAVKVILHINSIFDQEDIWCKLFSSTIESKQLMCWKLEGIADRGKNGYTN